MRKFVLLAGLLLLPLALMAQETTSKADLYMGLSYVRLSKTNQLGWDAALAGNFNKNLALVADVSGYYNSQHQTVSAFQTQTSGSIHSILVGPRLSDPRGKWTPFAQALFGWSRVHSDLSTSTTSGTFLTSSNSVNAFGMALGGGLDYRFTPAAEVRIIQAEYFLAKPSGGTKQEGPRIGAGVLFHFGSRR